MVIDGVKKFLGIGPYATDTNIVKGDPYFYKYLENKYGEEEVEKAMNLLHKTSTITFAKQNNRDFY